MGTCITLGRRAELPATSIDADNPLELNLEDLRRYPSNCLTDKCADSHQEDWESHALATV